MKDHELDGIMKELHCVDIPQWSLDSLTPLATDQIQSLDIQSLDLSSIYSTITATSADLVFPDPRHAKSRLSLQGDDADIDINGRSLVKILDNITQRLAILEPNPELELEWQELRELGERYRALENSIKQKSKMWDTLKSMPPPEIE